MSQEERSGPAYINPLLLTWARVQRKLTVYEAASAFSIAPSIYREWEDGDSKPTLSQAQELATMLGIPFGYLYLSNPPTPEPSIVSAVDRPCSIEVESNFKGEIAIRTKWYFEPTLESAWEAFQNLTKVRAALKVQYLGGTETEIEQSLAFLRQMTGVDVKTPPQQDYTEQLDASVDAIKPGRKSKIQPPAPTDSAQAVSDRLGKAIETAQRAQENYPA